MFIYSVTLQITYGLVHAIALVFMNDKLVPVPFSDLHVANEMTKAAGNVGTKMLKIRTVA